jgi:alanyl-tRNA synthetase
VEQLIRDKAKGLKTELTQQIQEINGVQFLAVQVDLNPELKT